MIFFLDIDGVMVHANPHKQVEQATDSFYVFSCAAVETFNTIFIAEEDQVILSSLHCKYPFFPTAGIRLF